MKTRDFALETKDVGSSGEFEGYASTFGGQPDSYGDVVMPGAFAESLVRHKREGSMPLMLFGHDAGSLPIGAWTDMAEDGKGLWVKGQIDLEDPEGARVHRALKQKRIRGLSIGYETKDSERDDKRPGVNLLKEIELWEVSIVNFPANRRSLVTEVKAVHPDLVEKLKAGDRLSEREWEKLLKAGPFGLSNSEAERAVRINLKGQGAPGGTAEKGADFLRALLKA
jgi:HK97 family phage prohead protease